MRMDKLAHRASRQDKPTEQPLVSILMPVYNSTDFVRSEGYELLPKALDSLLGQSYKNFELLILDNQSTDSTPNICKSYAAKDSRIRYILDVEMRFPEAAINHLASFMQGKYCMVANDDDLWSPDYIKRMVEFLEEHPEADMAYSNGAYINIDGSFADRIIQSEEDTYSDRGSSLSNLCTYLLKRNPIPIAFGVFRAVAYRRILPFEDFDNLKANVDNLFMAKLFLLGHKCHYVDEDLFCYRRKGRRLDPSKLSHLDMPGLDKPLLIWLYYVRHQLYFFRKLVETSRGIVSAEMPRLYVECVAVDSFARHSRHLLEWIRNDYVREDYDKAAYSKIVEYIGVVLDPSLSGRPDIGTFPDDALDNVRFQPPIIARYLELCLSMMAALAKAVAYYNSLMSDSENSHLVRDLERLLGEETSRLEKEKVLVQLETGKTPEILVRTANEQVEGICEEPKLSVISASMNLGQFLEETIRSVANQTFRGFEHIVIDGGSTDDTLAILKRYPHIRCISEKDSGYLEALRKGLALAKGKYVMQCAVSDGYINSGWFQKCVDVLDANPEVSLVWGFPQYLTEDSKLGDISYPQFHHTLAPQKYDFFLYWLRTCFWLPEGNFCVRKEVLDKCFPPFPGSPRDLEPWLEFNYNFNLLGYLPYHVPAVANFGRTHENQLGKRERKSGVEQRKLEGYLKKVRCYRWKLMTGIATHVYRDGAHTILPVKFSVERFRRAYLGFLFAEARSNARRTRNMTIHLVTRYKWMRIRFIQPSIVCVAISLMRRYLSRQSISLLPPIPNGIRLHVGAGQNIIEGYENLDGYDNEQRHDFFQTQVKKFVRAEVLDTVYQAESVAEIRCHHMFEHISMLDVDRTLQGWNRVLKPGGLVWIEVPDFEGCARQILKLKREEDKEIFYRHIFGSQMGAGEFHYNGFTAKRLIKLLHDYGFEVKLAYVQWIRRSPRKPDIYYPSGVPLPDLTVKAIKVGSPKPEVINAEWTHIAYRKQYPNPELENLSSRSGSNDCGQ